MWVVWFIFNSINRRGWQILNWFRNSHRSHLCRQLQHLHCDYRYFHCKWSMSTQWSLTHFHCNKCLLEELGLSLCHLQHWTDSQPLMRKTWWNITSWVNDTSVLVPLIWSYRLQYLSLPHQCCLWHRKFVTSCNWALCK